MFTGFTNRESGLSCSGLGPRRQELKGVRVPSFVALRRLHRNLLPLDASRKHDTFLPVSTSTLDVPRIAQLCNALADEARVEIVARLLDGEKCVCDLTDALETGQSRLSYHLKVLKDAGLVTDRRDGRWSYYTLARDAFLETEALVSSLRPKATRALKTGCC